MAGTRVKPVSDSLVNKTTHSQAHSRIVLSATSDQSIKFTDLQHCNRFVCFEKKKSAETKVAGFLPKT